MTNYEMLKSRMDDGEVIILDGAIGTELQAMGVPMHPASWCGPGNYTHPATVRQMHERYIRAGADIITTNTFNTVRPALEASGYGEMVREINVRAVDAAIEARDRAAGDRSVYIAGSISCRMPIRDKRTGALVGGTGYGYGASLSTKELRGYVDEQAEILAESGVDFSWLRTCGRTTSPGLLPLSRPRPRDCRSGRHLRPRWRLTDRRS